MAHRPIRVLVVDDHAVVREGITALLADCDDLAVVAVAGSAAEALERCGEVEVDVVLMDLSMPEVDGATATRWILDRHPDVRVVVLTGFLDETALRAAIQAGASGCLLKTVSASELAGAISGVVAGRSTFSSAVIPQLLSPPQAPGSAGPRLGLTVREHEVLTLLAEGLTNRVIANELGLTEGTVRVYVSSVLAKLGAANRTEATSMALRQGLLDNAR
jgi:DNA-binding NarL/FixJ family response regulator